MSRWEEIIAEPSVTLETLHERLAKDLRWRTFFDPGESVSVGMHDQSVIIRQNVVGYSDCDPAELAKIPIAEPVLYVVEFPYDSLELLRQVMVVVADDPAIWFCAEWTGVFHGPDLVARLRREPTWSMGVLSVGEICAQSGEKGLADPGADTDAGTRP